MLHISLSFYVLSTCSFHFVYRNSTGSRTDTNLRQIITEMHRKQWGKLWFTNPGNLRETTGKLRCSHRFHNGFHISSFTNGIKFFHILSMGFCFCQYFTPCELKTPGALLKGHDHDFGHFFSSLLYTML